MKKLSKSQVQEREKFSAAVRTATEAYNEAVRNFNVVSETAHELVQDARTALNDRISEARDWASGIAADQSSYYDDKSERWQEGDAGQAYDGWKQEFENFDLDDRDETEFVALDEIEDDLAETIDNLPDEPS